MTGYIDKVCQEGVCTHLHVFQRCTIVLLHPRPAFLQYSSGSVIFKWCGKRVRLVYKGTAFL